MPEKRHFNLSLSMDSPCFEERAREILREELQNVRFVLSDSQGEARESQEIAVDGEISDFLSALQSGRLDM